MAGPTHEEFMNGKICYIEIPASSVTLSAKFYEAVFGWTIRRRDDGQHAFSDGEGGVSGTWVVGRTPDPNPGMITYIMVDDIDATMTKIQASGGKLATPRTPLPRGDAWATFIDPADNLLGLYQQPR